MFSGRVGKDSLLTDIAPFYDSEHKLHMALLSPVLIFLHATLGASILPAQNQIIDFR